MKKKLEEIYQQYSQNLFLCALAITQRNDLAEDAIHNAFIKLLGLKKSPDNLKLFVFACVRNAAIDLVRKESRRTKISPPYIFQMEMNPRMVTETNEFQARVLSSLNQLSEDERETVIQYLYGELTFKEISELRQISQNTVASWYRRGLEKIRMELEKVSWTHLKNI